MATTYDVAEFAKGTTQHLGAVVDANRFGTISYVDRSVGNIITPSGLYTKLHARFDEYWYYNQASGNQF